MNKTIFAFLFMLSSHLAVGQISICIRSGYQLPFAKTLLGSGVNVTYDTLGQNNYLYGYADLMGSFASGVSNSLMLSYKVNKNLALDFGINYSRYKKYTASFDFANTFNYTESIQAKNYIVFMPSISYYHSLKCRLNPYGRIGVTIPSLGHIELSRIANLNNTSSMYLWNYKTKWNVGIHTCLGIEYLLKNNISFLAEIISNNMTLSFSKASMISYKVDGADKLSTLTVSDKEIEFVSSYEESAFSNPDQNKPKKAISYRHSFSYIGFLFGLKFGINKKK